FQKSCQFSGLHISDKLAKAIGTSTFCVNPITRPVMHLPTRDYYRFQTNRLSPTSYSSVDSGAISPREKSKLFSVLEGYDMK
ncbi:hypothetical protein, partial [Klebsiella pneumoniae]